MEIKTCEGCEEAFEPHPRNPHQIYCSKRCKSRAATARYAQRAKRGDYGTCSVDGCSRNVYTAGLCYLHNGRKARKGDPGLAELQRRGPRPCKVDVCQNLAVTSDDLCPTHRRRKQLYGNPDGSFATHKKCVVCGGQATPGKKSSDYCKPHYFDFMRREVFEGREPGGVNRAGYRMVSILGKVYAAHRLVMEEVLGRPLRDFENIHHRNGVRHDNRPQNLELWVKPQMPGRRVVDLVAWVVEHYPNEVSEALNRR